MWFNEDNEFANDYSEATAHILGSPPNSKELDADILYSPPNSKKLDADPDGIAKIVDKKAAAVADGTNNGPKPASGTLVKAMGILNNNAAGSGGHQPPGSVPSEMRSALFKRVSACPIPLLKKKKNKNCIQLLKRAITFSRWSITRRATRTRRTTRAPTRRRRRRRSASGWRTGARRSNRTRPCQ